MMKKSLAVSALALFMATAGAQTLDPIAILSKITGDVLINRGDSYRLIRPGDTAELRPGDIVLTRHNAAVDLIYTDGCVLRMPANGLLTLTSPDECTQGSAAQTSAALGDPGNPKGKGPSQPPGNGKPPFNPPGPPPTPPGLSRD